MGKSEQKIKSQRMAADLIARGYYHGRKQSSPNRNSGGMTFSTTDVGSSKYQRMQAKRLSK